jgi:hypothetical protein
MLISDSYCGLWSLRPSFGRVSTRGVVDTLQGQEAVKTSVGPITHSPEDLDLFMQAYMASEPWRSDPAVLNMPWRKHDDYQKDQPLCFAIAFGSEQVSFGFDQIRSKSHITLVYPTPASDARFEACRRSSQSGRTYSRRLGRNVPIRNDQ